MKPLDGPEPAYFAEGERLYLREVRPSDVNEDYYRWMNNPDITRFLESRFYPNSMESLRSYVAKKLEDRDTVFLAIVLKAKDQHIGNIKIGPINWLHRFADVGVLIGDKANWGKGYATEAIGLVMRYATNVLNLHRLTAGCYVEAVGSSKSFLKAGFRQEGLRTGHFFSNGRYTDEILLGVVLSTATKYKAVR